MQCSKGMQGPYLLSAMLCMRSSTALVTGAHAMAPFSHAARGSQWREDLVTAGLLLHRSSTEQHRAINLSVKPWPPTCPPRLAPWPGASAG